ncbi:MAG TPA: FtsX-like permease family protein [Tenuifilaceae bacterium]|nr:FtsX-like permease family protein [Tenuifilaceae bacterium]
MNFPFYIARRYLFAKKSHNVINIISIISVVGMATGVMALVVVLSVFNGFDMLIRNMISVYESDIKIVPVEGKTFSDTLPQLHELKKHPSVAVYSEILQENALFKYRGRQHIGTIKGVSRNYPEQSGIDSMIIDGSFQLWRGSQPLAIMGNGVAAYLNANLAHFDPLEVFMPRRGRQPVLTSAGAFNSKAIMPSGVFKVEQEFDTQFILAPIEFVRGLMKLGDDMITSIEIKLSDRLNPSRAQQEIQEIAGSGFRVLNRYQQNESIYKTMKSEKFAIVLILSLILVIASFNIIGSLSMLIIDKRKDVDILRSLGADNRMIQKIFMAEGMLIAVAGSILGALVGLFICWLQVQFKLVTLQGMGGFITDAYPVDIQLLDISLVLLLVIGIGYLAARFPVRYITGRIFARDDSTTL